MNLRILRLATLTGLCIGTGLWLGACVALFPDRCEQFEKQRQQTNYATIYRANGALGTDIKPLAKTEIAAARRYELSLEAERVRPCSHVAIRKELVLLRRDSPGAVIEETREFFAENGARITVKSEVLTDQLLKSGRYTASAPLPIPKEAPPGVYRLTSTLTLKVKGNNKKITLAKANANFQVIASKN